MKSLAFCLFTNTLLLISCNLYGQSQHAVIGHQHHYSEGPLNFIENNRQWAEEVLFKTNFQGSNTLFIEKNGFTFLLTHPQDLEKLHLDHKTSHREREQLSVRQHAYRVKFVGGQSSKGSGIARRTVYHNYYLGNDPSGWAGQVGLYGKVEQKNVYPGIHLETYSQQGHLKYDFIVEPHANPSLIKMAYEGMDRLELVEGNLEIHTSVGILSEISPVAWQEIDGKRIAVPCYFQLNKNTLNYTFPDGYDENHELIIDPVIIASTMTGTTGSSTSLGNWGHSATYDNGGNIYAAGISFVTTFPTTLGAFQSDWAGGANDIAIIKYNDDGSDMIYATYIGGSGDDFPHSIITDFNQQVYIYGSTTSGNYPVTGNAFQTDFGGSRDIIVSILNQDGTALVGSSFFGGNNDDGYNDLFSSSTHSYGDEFRGEIVLDGQNNVYVVSNSQSWNFPVTGNAYDNSFSNNGNSSQDVVVFKTNPDLSILYWSTFLGGSGPDSGNGIRVDESYNVYVTGTAGSGNFPTTNGTVQSNWPGGQESGYLAKLSADGSTLLTSTFFGTGQSDNSYFVDIDEDGNVHIFGKTRGNIQVNPPGTYSGAPGSNQFLAAFNNNLTESIYSTVIGDGPNFFSYDFIPVAFMVDKCNGIYFSGYEAVPGLPTSPGSFPDQNPISNDFYLGVLTPNATGLHYATYYGEADHVDGGTSRFDKGGVVYQGVCSCDWSGNLTTLPNAWATGQQTGCDIGVFKIDLEIEAINANGIAMPSTSGCAPFDVEFAFTGTNATSFAWKIDSVIISDQPDHNYTFTEAGTYDVELVVSNPIACNPTDTFRLKIDVLDGESTLSDTTICIGEDLFLDATTPNGSYSWQDGSSGSTYLVNTPGTYWVDVSIEGCSRRDSFVVGSSSEVSIDLGPDSILCDVSSYQLDATDPGILSYEWQNGSSEPVFTAIDDGLYFVNAIDTNGCLVSSSVELTFGKTPVADLGPDLTLCDGASLELDPDLQNSDPLWQNGSTEATFIVDTPGTYWVELDNEGCRDSDSISVAYYPPIQPNTTANSIVCANDCNGMAMAEPTGGSGQGYTYLWSTGETSSTLIDLCPDSYSVSITDSNNCTAEESTTVDAPPPLEMSVALEDVACAGDGDGTIIVSGVSGGIPPYLYAFDGGDFTDVNGVSGLSGGTYEVTVQDENGCLLLDTVSIYEPEPFVVFAGQDIEVSLGAVTSLQAQIMPYSNQLISWTPPDFLDCTECLTPTLCPTRNMLYTLTVTDPVTGCFIADSVLVTVDKERMVYLPNAFSPNNDGANDFYTVFGGLGVEKVVEMRIFDRWGELVFENYNFAPNDVTQGWNGSFKGQKLSSGVYVFYAKVLFKDEVRIIYEGDIHLIR